MALLDTTVLIDLSRSLDSRAHRLASAAVQRLLEAGQTLFTSRINEAEFRVGPEMSRDRQLQLLRVEIVLSGIVILEFNAEAAFRYAVIKAATLKIGRPVGDCDALIASVALANGQSLLTRNPRHFVHIPGLAIENY